ncbi:MAG: RDD family protein [Clostridia bacterium]|nr:RDD family protein [Clostridia bacterium]
MLGTAKGSSERNLDLEPNSKPYLLKRLISDGFDTVVIFLLYFVLSLALFASPLANNYNEHLANYKKEIAAAREEYGEDAAAITQALNANRYFLDERTAMNIHGFLIKLLAVFIAEAAVLLAAPLISKERKTPGKMLTGVMPFCERKNAKASRLAVFGRFVFVFLIDSVILGLLTGTLTFVLVPVIRLIEILLNKKNKTLCDALSGIMIIEQLSYNGIN